MISLQNVEIRAGKFALANLNFHVNRGEYAVLMGRTGCGKTSIVESICGLRRIHSGTIIIQDTDVTGFPPGDRRVGYVPQDLALFPNLNVAQHLTFAMRLRKESRQQIAERVESTADVLGIGHLLGRGTMGLSGGESQRVALGRAIAFEPAVLLLDEPLSALDEATRVEMQALLLRLKESTGVTTLHITHNTVEAAALADRTFHLHNGVIEEVGGVPSASDR